MHCTQLSTTDTQTPATATASYTPPIEEQKQATCMHRTTAKRNEASSKKKVVFIHLI